MYANVEAALNGWQTVVTVLFVLGIRCRDAMQPLKVIVTFIKITELQI